MTLVEMLGGESTVQSLAELVGGLSEEQRRLQCLSLGPRDQRRLWQVLSEAPLIVGDLLADGAGVFAGRNSLRLFSRFEKRFVLHEGALVGRNVHPLAPLIGPGYFTVRGSGSAWLEFDYSRVPVGSPTGWPAVKNNLSMGAKPVYGGLRDRVAWVSPDVLIGAAFREGTPLDSYFVLVRGR